MEKRTEHLISGLGNFGIKLSESILLRELEFLDELLRWSDRINLTAIKNQQEGIEKHLIDSLVLLLFLRDELLLDLGTGAGIPSIPLAIARPELAIVSVESVGKKVNFQKHVRRKLSLNNLTPLNCRVESLVKENSYPQITARAFAPLDKILALVHPLLTPGGRLLLLRGSKDEVNLNKSTEALSRFDFIICKKHSYQLPFCKANRQILEISRS
ncbi:16S rRNA (guanine(527)-N(7))-methyltransferase RsmG [Geopsychrobacter electrodiphilus]|uniref:16S rRNA (guanine(527)-N(7))-methyltransferase RsmG n=1 Tax=Geopsychrobacter electrodiphilus TaxID=225196 RepID=UPI00036BBCAC|nr:16S rRNA (guanine(527)-N(7))-methyltransferase RsmG [Geopsychrobacter electrodiphilus]